MPRKKLLNKLIAMKESIATLNSELEQFSWDSDKDLIILKKYDVINALDKFLNKDISSSELESWANAIECREDIGYESLYDQQIDEIVFEIANPDLSGALTEGKARSMIETLK